MRNLSIRLTVLEAPGRHELSPRAKAWLGWQLSATEMDAVNAETAHFDPATLSKEARQWLGID